MSIRWAEPWEPYGGDVSQALQGPWAQFDGGHFTLSNTKPRTGSWSLTFSSGVFLDEHVRRVVGDSLTSVKVGYAIWIDKLPDFEFSSRLDLLDMRDAANNVQLIFTLGTNGQVVLYRGAQGGGGGNSYLPTTFIARSDPTILLPSRAYTHLEFYAEIGNTDGAVEVRMNEVTIMNLTGIDTQASGNAEVSQIGIATVSNAQNYNSFGYIDDIICSDGAGSYNTGFVGDKKVFYLAPNSVGPDNDFTVSTGGDSYTVLDEIPADDTDYLSLGAGLTGKTSVGCSNLPGNTSSVSAVIAMIRAWKDDAGTCDMKPGILQGSTYASGAGQHVTTAPNYYFEVFETDPVTGVPFVQADVDSLDLVIERSA